MRRGDEVARPGRPQKHIEEHSVSELPIRPGDTVVIGSRTGNNDLTHGGLVESYNRETGVLIVVHGNAQGARPGEDLDRSPDSYRGGRLARTTFNLNDPDHVSRIHGFGRPAPADFASQ
jgi:hypothetical protein